MFGNMTTTAENPVVEEKNWFVELSKVDVSPFVEKKGGKGFSPSYISWASAWGLMSARDPEASFRYVMYKDVINNVEFEVPYIRTPFGYIVEVEVTFKGNTKREQLAVMDNRFNAIMEPTVRDITDAQKRCLVKCIAAHGLGLNLYVKDGIPTDFENENHTKHTSPEPVHQTQSQNIIAATDAQKAQIKQMVVEIASLTLGASASQEELNSEMAKIFARYKIGANITAQIAEVKKNELQAELKRIHDTRMTKTQPDLFQNQPPLENVI